MGRDVRGHGGGGGARCAPWSLCWTPAPDREARPSQLVKHSPAFLKLVDDAKARVREVSVSETQRRLETRRARVIDVREDNEWAAGRVRGAEHMGRGVIERDIEVRVPDKAAELILYCGGGFRSALSADSLQKMGYTNVSSMAGGWRAWKDAGAPIDEGNPGA